MGKNMPGISLLEGQCSHQIMDSLMEGLRMFTVVLDINVHKYLGIQNQEQSTDPSQPNYMEPDPLGIQDFFLFLEEIGIENMTRIFTV